MAQPKHVENFHLARSLYLDAMAGVEQEVARLIRLTGGKVASNCLGQKCELLKLTKPSPALSKEAVVKLIAAVDGILGFLEERNAIVHAVLECRMMDGAPVAIFANLKFEQATGSRAVRLISEDGFAQSIVGIRKLHGQLCGIGLKKAPAKESASSVVPLKEAS